MDIDYYINNKINTNDEFIKEAVEKIRQIKELGPPIYQILIIGKVESLKSNLSAYLAKEGNFDYTFVLSNVNMIGMSEKDKIFEFKRVFETAYEKKHSCIVIDSLETLIEYHRDSKSNKLRFMSFLFNTIKTLLYKRPIDKECKILVILNSIKMSGLDLDDYVQDYLILE